jgi:hypothetical protein
MNNISLNKGKFIEYEYLEKNYDNLLQNSTSYQTQIQELEGKEVADIFLILRPNSLIRANDASDYTDSNVRITSWYLKSGSTYLNGTNFDITYSYYNTTELPRLSFEGQQNILNRNEVVISFCNNYVNNNKEDLIFYSGSKSFKGVKDATLKVNFSSLGSTHTLTVLCRFAKIMGSEREGDLLILKDIEN